MKAIKLGATKAKRAVKRSVQLTKGPTGQVMVVSVGQKLTGYTLKEFPTDWHGRAFTLSKLFGGSDDAEPEYACFVAGTSGAYDECGCKGFYRHRQCKHLDSIKELIHAGHLPPLSDADKADPQPCPWCAGNGVVAGNGPDNWSEPVPCPVCGGK